MRGLHLGAAVLAALVVSACSGSETIPEGDPATRIGTEMRGYEIDPGIMVGEDDKVNWTQLALADYRETTADDLPSKVLLVPAMNKCSFRAPAEGELVANVHVGRSPMKTPIYVFSKKDLAKRTKDWLVSYKRLGEDARLPSDPGGDAMHAVDVVVTETSKPVYLALQNEWSNIVWNIQAAPGVKIAHVAVLGMGAVGVANLDPSVPAEFLDAEALSRCKVKPVREPADYWIFVKRAKAGTSGNLDDKLEENKADHRAYSRWFDANFATPSERGVIGMESASQVIVGPLPSNLDKRVPYKPLAGAEVRLSREDYVLVTSKDEYRAKHEGMVHKLAEEMAGGDLKSLYKGS